MMVRVVTDSTADVPADMVSALGITVIPSYVVFGSESYRDGVELTKPQFYEKLLTTQTVPVTAAPSPHVYGEAYRRLSREAGEIISIHLASKYSSLYSAATIGAREVSEATVAVVDSEQVTMGYGWMVVAAAEAAQQGATLAQIVALVEGMKPRSRVLAVLDTLDFLYRGGRVDWVQATLGTLLRIKPILEVRPGEILLAERVRTLERALVRLLDRIRALGPLERAIVLHANAPDLAHRMADQLQTLVPDWDRLIGQAGVTIASHAGPGAVGIACVTAE
ncbi:MAG: DegV family protein [Anaerolineae bacterium]|jgi:DegV family protein with EDD domain